MDILCCPDNNYVMPTGIMMVSLLENNASNEITFHIISENLSQDNKDLLTNTAKGYGASIYFYNIGSKKLVFNTGGSYQRKLPVSTYWRLYASEILPKYVNKLIYLDGDIIVRGTLSTLLDLDMTDIAIAGVPDENLNNGSIHSYNLLEYSPKKGYFNAGVLVINLQRWRETSVFAKIRQYMLLHSEPFHNHDQDILNYIFQDDKIELPITYNFQVGFMYKPEYRNISYEYNGEITDAARNPVILHFNTCVKPWYKDCDHPYREEFIKYKAISYWKDSPIKKSYMPIKDRFKNIGRKILVLSGLVDKHRWVKEWAYSSEEILKK